LLQLAAAHGYRDICELLVTIAGADVNQPDGNGMTALHYAAEHGDASVCDYLIDCGADMNARDEVSKCVR
jgi:ankyrin repeat protein